MDTEESKRLVRRYYEEVVSTGAVDEVPCYIAPSYVEVYRNRRYDVGVEGAATHIRGVRQTYPDLRLRVDQQIAEGEWVVSCVTMTGTPAATWMGIRPTGKAIEVTVVNVDRVVAGHIVEHGGAAELLEPLMESGAVVPA